MPIDTHYVFINPDWVANKGHADVIHDANLWWLQKYAESEDLVYDHEHKQDLERRVTHMPEGTHATDSTVYSKRKYHVRENVSENDLKFTPTDLACDIVAVILTAQKNGVGNMVLLSYKMGKDRGGGIAYREGAYMFAVNNQFMQNIRTDLFEKMSTGFEAGLEEFHTKCGKPDFMKALIHLLVSDGTDGKARGYGACRLVPSFGSVLRYDPPLHSSLHFENTQLGKCRRLDEKTWKDKNTLGGCLGSAEKAEKKIPQLYSINIVGQPVWYGSVKANYTDPVSNTWYLTYIDVGKHFQPGCNGDRTGVVHMVDGISQKLYGLQIPSLDSRTDEQCKNFTKKCRRRNKRIQCEGRIFTGNMDEALSHHTKHFLVVHRLGVDIS